MIIIVLCIFNPFQGAHPWLVSDHSPKSVSPPAVMAWSTVSLLIPYLVFALLCVALVKLFKTPRKRPSQGTHPTTTVLFNSIYDS